MCGVLESAWGQRANFKQAEKFRKAGEEIGSLNVAPHFLKKSDKFWFSYRTSEGTQWYFVDPAKRDKRLLFENAYLAQELTKITFKPYSLKALPLKELEFKDDQKTLKFQVDEFNYEYNIDTRLLVQKDSVKTEKNKNNWATYAPDSTYVLFARKHNLYMMKVGDKDSVEIQLKKAPV